MKKSFSQRVLIGTAFVAAMWACVAPAFASIGPDDVQPAPWRGLPGTTSQFWLFNSPNPIGSPIQPDGSLGQPWLPSTHITVQPLGDWIQSDPVSGRFGIWPLSGRMNVTVDNYPQPNPVKYMWVQVVWQPQAGLPNTGPILSGFDPAGTEPVAIPATLPNGWYETTFEWQIYPNPPDEFFVIGGNINVDQVIIDTYCVPEPSSVLLTALGGGLLLVLRRRR